MLRRTDSNRQTTRFGGTEQDAAGEGNFPSLLKLIPSCPAAKIGLGRDAGGEGNFPIGPV